MINQFNCVVNRFELTKNDFINRDNNNLDIEKELEYIENYPETNIKVEDYIL